MSITGKIVFLLANKEQVVSSGIVNKVIFSTVQERESLFRKAINDLIIETNKESK